MFSRGCALGAVCGIASVAVADIAIDLRPDATGPYTPGQIVNVEAYFVDDGLGHPITGEAIALRGFQIDFTDTDPTIKLPATMNLWPYFPEFPFLLPDLPRPGALLFPYPFDPLPFMIPVGGESIFGDLDVTINDSGWIDVMNADEPDPAMGAWINFGFGLGPDDPVTTWQARTGELTGGRLFMEVPEPASLALLALGGVVLARRRNPLLERKTKQVSERSRAGGVRAG